MEEVVQRPRLRDPNADLHSASSTLFCIAEHSSVPIYTVEAVPKCDKVNTSFSSTTPSTAAGADAP